MLFLPEESACRAVSYEMLADAEPGLLPRALAPFARRNLIPDRVQACRDGELVRLEIAMDAMPLTMLHLVEGNLRQIVGVQCVAVICAGLSIRP
jgi:hypothetical protein